VAQNSPCEIIVIDGHSTDTTLDIVAEFTDRVYCDNNRGISYARQLGAEKATGEYILYVDSDVVLQPDTLTTMLSELRTNGYGALSARVLRDNVLRVRSPGEVEATIPMLCTLLRRESILSHGFDPGMPNCDDFEISYQLLRHGHRIAVSIARVHHEHKDRGTSLKHQYRVGKAQAEFLLKYRRAPRVIVTYVIARGLGSPVHELVLCVVQRRFRLIPRLIAATAFLTAGFLWRLCERAARQ